MRFDILKSNEISSYAPQIAEISNIVYKEYPYLYDVEEDESFYVKHYCRSPDSKLLLAYEDDKLVGYLIGIPIKDYFQTFQQPFLDHGINFDTHFYLGEFAILPEYRNQKLGTEMLSLMEASIKRDNLFSKLCLANLDEQMHAIPENNAPLTTYWAQFGYKQHPELSFKLHWKQLGSLSSSAHTLIYWIKSLEVTK